MRKIIVRLETQCDLDTFIDVLKVLQPLCSEDGAVKIGGNHIAIESDDEEWPDTSTEMEKVAHNLLMEVYNTSDGAVSIEVQ